MAANQPVFEDFSINFVHTWIFLCPKRQAIGKKSYRKSGLIPPDVVEQIDELTVGEREVYNYAKTLLAKKLAERQRKNPTCASSSSLVSRVVNKVRSWMNG
ncbi:hypothetical protein [Aerosakkonema funiforme]|uniref:hypothetical protein n=1 Tax=Aerosakkonema funiforme TaxID=1246630 RepID=UPI0035B72E82